MNEKNQSKIYEDVEFVGVEQTIPAAAVDTEIAADTDNDEAAVLRAEIEQTRSDLSETVTAIQEKLDPHVLVEQAKSNAHDTAEELVEHAKEAVHDATIGKVEHMVSGVTNSARELVSNATGSGNYSSGPYTSQVQRQPAFGGSVLETIKQNPIPTALSLGGLVWLWTHRAPGPSTQPSYASLHAGTAPGAQSATPLQDAGQQTSQKAAQMRDNVVGTAGQVQNRAGQVAAQASDTVKSTAAQIQSTAGNAAGTVSDAVVQLPNRAGQLASQGQSSVQTLLQENPLAAGAAGIAIGLAIGLTLPSTEKESQIMGGPRDSLMDSALGTVQETLQKAGNMVEQTGNTVTQAAHKGLQQAGSPS